jgi:type II secretory pathway pseudopilin PulG
MMRLKIGRERGFSLLETMVSIGLFAVVTLGLIPLLASSLRGSTLARSYTVGKNVTSRAMEYARGLPFYISFASQTQKVDVLDVYFPDLTAISGGTGYTSGTATYSLRCTSSTTSTIGCPKQVPAGYTVDFAATFVNPSQSGTGAETYTAATPPSSPAYRWDVSGQDRPPARLLRLTVATSWAQRGQNQGYTLTTLLTDRKFGAATTQAKATVDYTVQAQTSFVSAASQFSNLALVAGSSDTDTENEVATEVDQSTVTATAEVTRRGSVTTPAVSLAVLNGARTDLHAPPDQDPATPDSSAAGTLVHPDIAQTVAWLDGNTTQNMKVKIASELPVGAGGFTFNSAGTSPVPFLGLAANLWINNQADTSPSSPLHLDPAKPVFYVSPATGGPGNPTLSGSTSVTTTALTDVNRRVQATASAQFRDSCLLTVAFQDGVSRCVVTISSFTSTVDCTAKLSGGLPTGSYSATLKYWRDTNNDGLANTAGAGYDTVSISVTQAATAADLLAPIKATNPRVYDSAVDSEDVYLFPKAGNPNYLQDWAMLTSVSKQNLDGGKFVSATIKGALQITTAPTKASLAPESGVSISVGSIGCEATDRR